MPTLAFGRLRGPMLAETSTSMGYDPSMPLQFRPNFEPTRILKLSRVQENNIVERRWQLFLRRFGVVDKHVDWPKHCVEKIGPEIKWQSSFSVGHELGLLGWRIRQSSIGDGYGSHRSPQYMLNVPFGVGSDAGKPPR